MKKIFTLKLTYFPYERQKQSTTVIQKNDRPMDGRTDRAMWRVAFPRLKRIIIIWSAFAQVHRWQPSRPLPWPTANRKVGQIQIRFQLVFG